MNIIIQPEDFLPCGRLAHVYIPNYLYLPVTLTDVLDIGDKDPNGILSHNKSLVFTFGLKLERPEQKQLK